jgi:ribosome-binding ATPase
MIINEHISAIPETYSDLISVFLHNFLIRNYPMQIGIVGLPSSGKTTLFQAITRAHLDESAARRKQANIAVVKVPDARVDKLADVFHPKKRVFASVEFVDVVGLKKGDHSSTQFTGSFLANVMTNDALIHVVRAFDDPVIPHPEGSVDPARDISILESEFILADMAIIEGRLERMTKQTAKSSTGDSAKIEIALLERCHAALEEEHPLRALEYDAAEERILRGYQFLSLKPILVVINVSEQESDQVPQILETLSNRFTGSHFTFENFLGKVEMELAQLSDEDAEAFMAEYGIKESALARIIALAYRMLGLITFLTCGEDECRAWPIKAGISAKEAAGAIHTDLSDRFIRAETVHFDDFVTYGSIAACKEKGAWRLEGKDYKVKDGDILNIRNS